MADTEETIRDFWALRDLGVRVAVDDFGTGYSSLSYLKRLPVDMLKIDKSFVDDIETDSTDVEIIRAIIAMAHSLNLKVVAEGVENAKQLECLQAAGCDQIQGYFFSRPLAAMLEKTGGTLAPTPRYPRKETSSIAAGASRSIVLPGEPDGNRGSPVIAQAARPCPCS